MQAWVMPLFSKGKPIAQGKEPPFVTGDLNMADGRNPVLGRLVSEACLLSDSGTNVLDPIVDVRLLSISAHGMQLRGYEYGAGGAQVAQEWWVRFTPPTEG
ncbi:TPA: hypothetical protein ACP3ZG_001596 [Pseudomonas aeruginosa]|uniref:Uncharacterized protein n=1 Tax=Pseudomonas aeruginosa TaxID=287 RepID=A0A241XSD4_PSEAI|nr:MULTISPECIES: hypothetical protein [Pseudomonas]ELG7182104.1 hypothetical protein [Pseudomonas aeruginosa]MBI6603322.1 hypothetical protein [Pseudomonas sp. S4_EA_1b]MBI8852517.1 hypothetical protein [Pseudomonas aeruginosa]OBY57591.1 hypothetical protein A9513_002915 [Pseudomonas sp. AU12215]OTI63255.1 hypothetical protein CAZ10_10520 [Pseudomonas aeruginosa]